MYRKEINILYSLLRNRFNFYLSYIFGINQLQQSFIVVSHHKYYQQYYSDTVFHIKAKVIQLLENKPSFFLFHKYIFVGCRSPPSICISSEKSSRRKESGRI